MEALSGRAFWRGRWRVWGFDGESIMDSPARMNDASCRVPQSFLLARIANRKISSSRLKGCDDDTKIIQVLLNGLGNYFYHGRIARER